MKNIILCVVSLAFLSGCATATRGTKGEVKIQYTPENAIVTTSLGDKCKGQPCSFKISRKKEFSVTAKAEGYEDQTVHVTTSIEGKGAAAIASNALAGGLIGIAVDAVTGASLSHSPNPVIINLKKIGEESSDADPESAQDEAEQQTAPTS